MKQEIVCPECAARIELHPLDAADGMKMRKTLIARVVQAIGAKNEVHVKQADGSWKTVHSEEIEGVVCDQCLAELTHQPAVALTFYKGPEPEFWEAEYGAIK